MTDAADVGLWTAIAGGAATLGGAAVKAWERLRASAGERGERREKRMEDRIAALEAARDRCEERIREAVTESEDRCAQELAEQRADIQRIADRLIEQRRASIRPGLGEPEDTGLHELEQIRDRTPTPPRSFPPVRPSELPPPARRARQTMRGEAPESEET